jgi:hypothetical protein
MPAAFAHTRQSTAHTRHRASLPGHRMHARTLPPGRPHAEPPQPRGAAGQTTVTRLAGPAGRALVQKGCKCWPYDSDEIGRAGGASEGLQ